MTHHARVLKRIIDDLQKLKVNSQEALVIFDLDSTLFDVRQRLENVLMNFAKEPENQKLFPEQVEYFKNIQILKHDWGIRDILVRAGLDGHHREFQTAVRDYWVKHFFSNEALVHDVPYAGAVQFVQDIAQTNAEIIYLTGRDIERMGEGSQKILQLWGFPLDEVRQKLILKPHRSMDDALFKRDWFQNIAQDKYQKILFFENEPLNIQHIRTARPEVEIIFFDSTHSRAAEPPMDLPTILHFLTDDQES